LVWCYQTVVWPGVAMAYRVIRLKKEARRNTKLDEIFQVI
jgi:hypothetical protein